MNKRDISSGIEQVIDMILEGLKFCFDFLDSITFYGISLLDFFITLFILGCVLPLVLTLLRSRSVGSERSRTTDEKGSGH